MRHPLLFDRSARARILFTGPNAVSTLNGLVTNDIAPLTPGHGVYAALLTAKGKIVADVRVLRRHDDVLMDTPPGAAAGMREMVKKFVNPRFATYVDVSDVTCDVGIFGDGAHELAASVAGLPGDAVAALHLYGHLQGLFEGQPITVVRTPDAGLPGYDLIGARELQPALWAALVADGATPADDETWTTLRVEAGWPLWGVDMSDSTLPQEANLDELHALSFTKGCYIGQEPVARIHFRGHVNRTLRSLAFQDEAIPPRGAQLVTHEGQEVGDVRSTARSPRLGPIGIGMVRREVEDGATLQVRWSAVDGLPGEAEAVVRGKAKGAIG
jgi:folate-binding protein YgfZ